MRSTFVLNSIVTKFLQRGKGIFNYCNIENVHWAHYWTILCMEYILTLQGWCYMYLTNNWRDSRQQMIESGDFVKNVFVSLHISWKMNMTPVFDLWCKITTIPFFFRIFVFFVLIWTFHTNSIHKCWPNVDQNSITFHKVNELPAITISHKCRKTLQYTCIRIL